MNKQEALKVLREQKVSGKNQLDNEVLDYLIKRLSKPTQSAFEIKEVKNLKKEKVVEETKRNIDFPVYMPEFSIKGDSSVNHIMLKGDNIQSLEFMKKSNVKVDIIYIDPPYGTGKSFTYNDKFEDEYGGQKHQAYINFMRSRLELASEVLSDNGTIFISIDDRQQARLKLLCDDIFGEDNFIACLPRDIGASNKTTFFFQNKHDYVLVYSRNDHFNKIDYQEDVKTHFKFTDERGEYSLIHPLDNGGLGYIPSLDFEIEINGRKFFPGMHQEKRNVFRWTWSKDLVDFGIAENVLVVKGDRLYKKSYKSWEIEKSSNGYRFVKKEEGKNPSSEMFFTEKYGNRNATRELKALNIDFDYPKPTSLLIDLIKLVPNWENSIILDFFAGSGTLGEAVMRMNFEYKANAKFIVCAKDDLNQKKEVEQIFENYMTKRIKNARALIGDTSTIYAFEMKSFSPQFTCDGIHVGKEVINTFEDNKKYIDEAFGLDCSIMPLESEEGRK